MSVDDGGASLLDDAVLDADQVEELDSPVNSSHSEPDALDSVYDDSSTGTEASAVGSTAWLYDDSALEDVT